MSRLRTTIDSVTKAVGSTDLISKFSRFKPGNVVADGSQAAKVPAKAETLSSNGTVAASSPKSEMKEDGGKNMAEEESDEQKQQVGEEPFVAVKKSTSGSAPTTHVSAQSSSTMVAKQTMQLFHPAALSTNMDETYKSLSHHINSYFGTNAQGEDGENRQQQHREGDSPVSEPVPHIANGTAADHIPVLSPVSETKSIEGPATSPVPSSPSEELSITRETPSSETAASESSAQSTPTLATSSKKGFTHYLSYPRPSVQAFVGSYIAPLVPRFRGDPKRVLAETDKDSAAAANEPTVEKADSEEEKAEKAKQQLLSQREKVGGYMSVITECLEFMFNVRKICAFK